MTTPQITVTFDPPLSTDSGAVFDEKAFDTVGKLNPWGVQVNNITNFTNEKVAEVAATALSGDLPDMTGHAGKVLTVNQAEDAVTFFPNHKPKNLLINGGMTVAQRGTSFTIAASASAYTADRWLVTNDTNQTVTVTQEALALGQTDMPNGARYKMRLAFSTAPTSGAVKIEQRIEDVQALWGRKMTLVGYVDGPAGSETLAANAVQHFGTGGSPSSDVTTAITLDRATIVGSAWQVKGTVDVPSVSGKVLGTDGNDYLAAQIVMTPRQTGNYEVGYLSTNEGDTTALENPFEARPERDVLFDCQYYFALVGAGGFAWAQNTTQIGLQAMLPRDMRDEPDLTAISGSGIGLVVRTGGAAENVNIFTSIFANGRKGMSVYGAGGGYTSGSTYHVAKDFATCSAEL